MIQQIVQGISRAINAQYGDGFEIYDQDVLQGLKEPCFLIQIIKPLKSPLLGRRSLHRTPFDIAYFPKNRTDNAEMVNVGEQLFETLEFITLQSGDQLRGTGMDFEIVDNVLHFSVSYNYTLFRPTEQPTMETLGIDTNVTKG